MIFFFSKIQIWWCHSPTSNLLVTSYSSYGWKSSHWSTRPCLVSSHCLPLQTCPLLIPHALGHNGLFPFHKRNHASSYHRAFHLLFPLPRTLLPTPASISSFFQSHLRSWEASCISPDQIWLPPKGFHNTMTIFLFLFLTTLDRC